MIELKSIKYSALASHETHCFEATLYVDGKKFGTVENSGHGGNTLVHPLSGDYADVAKLEESVKAHYPSTEFHGMTIPASIEIVTCELVNKFLAEREFKKDMKKVCYLKGGNLYVMASRFKPTPETIAAIKEKAKWAAGAVFLAEMDPSEAFDAWRKATA